MFYFVNTETLTSGSLLFFYSHIIMSLQTKEKDYFPSLDLDNER